MAMIVAAGRGRKPSFFKPLADQFTYGDAVIHLSIDSIARRNGRDEPSFSQNLHSVLAFSLPSPEHVPRAFDRPWCQGSMRANIFDPLSLGLASWISMYPNRRYSYDPPGGDSG